MKICRLNIQSEELRKLTGLEECFVVIDGNKVIENGPNCGLHPTRESAEAFKTISDADKANAKKSADKAKDGAK